MKCVRIYNWRTGFQKVSFTKLVCDSANLSLGKSKKITDDILEGREAVIELEIGINVRDFLSDVRNLGVEAEEIV